MNRYMIIIGAFTTENHAKSYAKKLENDGYPSFIIEHSESKITPVQPAVSTTRKTTKQLYDEVMAKGINGQDRKNYLGSRYQEVQDYINSLTSNPARKTTKQLYEEVMAGKHGSGEARKKSLGNRYQEVQEYINKHH